MTDQTAADARAIAQAKRVLRDAVRLRRSARHPEQRVHDDEQRFARMAEALTGRLAGRVAGSPEPLPERPVRRLAAYLSAGDEPDTLRLVSWAVAHGIEVLLPVLSDGAGAWLPRPVWAAYAGPDTLRRGRAGILEPSGPLLDEDPLAGVDLVVVPGLAADGEGHRLGRGGGWYDRARATHPELETWLLLNDDEVLAVVPTDTWDLPVHRLVTPTRVIATQPPR